MGPPPGGDMPQWDHASWDRETLWDLPIWVVTQQWDHLQVAKPDPLFGDAGPAGGDPPMGT